MNKRVIMITAGLILVSGAQASMKGSWGALDLSVQTEATHFSTDPFSPSEGNDFTGGGAGLKASYRSHNFLIPPLSMGAGVIVAQPVLDEGNGVNGAGDPAGFSPAWLFGYGKAGDEATESAGTAYINELYFKFAQRGWELKLLLQELDTPMVGSGDNTLMPNSYNAVDFHYWPGGGWMIDAGYVMAMAGADVGAHKKPTGFEVAQDRDSFQSMSKALTGSDTVDDQGLWMIGATYNPSGQPVQANFYYYTMLDFEVAPDQEESMGLLYGDFKYSGYYEAIYDTNSKGERYVKYPRRERWRIAGQYYSGDFTINPNYSVFGLYGKFVPGRHSPFIFDLASTNVSGDG